MKLRKINTKIKMEAAETTHQLAVELIKKDFEIVDHGENISEAELFQMLADHIDWLLEHRMEWLLSLMYRMDVNEQKVQQAIAPDAPDPANIGLAKLVLERQKQRAYTKQTYKPEDLGEEWDW